MKFKTIAIALVLMLVISSTSIFVYNECNKKTESFESNDDSENDDSFNPTVLDDNDKGDVSKMADITYYGTDGLTYAFVGEHPNRVLTVSGSGSLTAVRNGYLYYTNGSGGNVNIQHDFNSLIIEDTITSIPSQSEADIFFDCTSLISAKLPSGLTIIPDRLFSGCGNLESIDMSNNITSIGMYAFSGCNKYVLNPKIPTGAPLELKGGCYSLNVGVIDTIPSNEREDIVIPANVTSMGSRGDGTTNGISVFGYYAGDTSVDSNKRAIVFLGQPTLTKDCLTPMTVRGVDISIYTRNNWIQGYNPTPIKTPAGSVYYYNLYYIDYHTDGNVEVGYKKQNIALTLPTREKEHYDFQGWYSSQDGGTQYADPYTQNTDAVMYARFTGKRYKVRYNVTSGATLSPSKPSGYDEVQYPNGVTLPNVIKQYYDFDGWALSGSQTPSYHFNEVFYPTSDTVLDSILSIAVYTTLFKDADGKELAKYVQEYSSLTPVNIPLNNHTAFSFVGWFDADSTSDTPVLTNEQTYLPVSNRTFVRKYTYRRYLRGTNKDNAWTGEGTVISGTLYPTISQSANTTQLPVQDVNRYIANDNNIPRKYGYRIKGWSSLLNPVDETSNDDVNYTAIYRPVLNDDDTSKMDDNIFGADNSNIYVVWRSAELESIEINDSVMIRTDETTSITATITPQDWLGSLNWESSDDGSHFSVISNGRLGAKIFGISNTMSTVYTINALARKALWDAQSEFVRSNLMYVTVTQLITAYFYTRNDDGTVIPFNKPNHEGNAWYVYSQSGVTKWTTLDTPPDYSYEEAYPGDATRRGYIFIGWLSDDGKLVTFENPPLNDVNCYATWTQVYDKNIDRDMLVIQKLNSDGDSMEMQLDMGLLTSLRENFELSLSPLTTPTMSSENTFLTDLYCTENIPVKFIRKSPMNPNDSSDNPLNWSNRHWLETIRKELVDRWQSATDGIKILYIPRGIRIPEDANGNLKLINGQIVCYGDNYDLLGYAMKRYNDDGSVATNLGLIFKGPKYQANGVKDEYVLQGYNGLISTYKDSYGAENISAVAVDMTFVLGGMRVEYQDFADGLLLR